MAKEEPTIEAKLRTIVSEQLGVDEDEVTANTSFEHDLGADSLDRVELVMCIEEAFDIQVADEDAEGIKTVKDAVAYIAKELSSAKKRA
jgi:acyl carrier protein